MKDKLLVFSEKPFTKETMIRLVHINNYLWKKPPKFYICSLAAKNGCPAIFRESVLINGSVFLETHENCVKVL